MCQILSFAKKKSHSFIHSFHLFVRNNTSSSKSLQVIDFIDGINDKKKKNLQIFKWILVLKTWQKKEEKTLHCSFRPKESSRRFRINFSFNAAYSFIWAA